MTWTYSSTSITTDLAKVRLTIGDTNSNDPLLTDEEINYQLSLTDDIDRAAAECVRLILGQIARDIDRQGTGFSASRSQKFQHYKDLLEELQAKSRTVAGMTATGLTDSEEEALLDDDDYTPAAFRRNLHDYQSGE